LLQINKDYDRRNFVDYVKTFVSSGRMEKDPLTYTERNLLKGGPDGGDGGRGGHVFSSRKRT
jgi:GTP-binding protein